MANTHKVWWLDAGARLGGTDCITFFATAPVAAPWAPQRLNSVVERHTRKRRLSPRALAAACARSPLVEVWSLNVSQLGSV